MFSADTSVIMAMMVEEAQRMLTKRPTVPRISEGVIGFTASKPTRASEPRTEIMRPNDAAAFKLVIDEFASHAPVGPTMQVRDWTNC
jgi:hypothetical protein